MSKQLDVSTVWKLLGLFVAIGFVVGVLSSILLGVPSAIRLMGVEWNFPTATASLEPAAISRDVTDTPIPNLAETEEPSTLGEPSSVPGDWPESSGGYLCDEDAFDGDLTTSDPTFLRPNGYLSGWISSDPSTVILPDGTAIDFQTQYVLIVEDLVSAQVQGVQRMAGKASTSGCWYSVGFAKYIFEDAVTEFCKKKAGNSVAVLYRASAAGFEELGTTATFECP